MDTAGTGAVALTPAAAEEFARLVGVGTDTVEAYRRSGIGGVLACTVNGAMGRADIRARVAWLRENMPAADDEAPVLTAADVTDDLIVRRLDEDRTRAIATGQANAAVRATELMGKLVGKFVERSVAVTAVVDVPDLELAQRIAYLLTTGDAGPRSEVLIPAPD